MKLELKGITKNFGDFRANDNITFTAESGKIHALLGENGAGKTTLMNILFGLLRPDAGEILIDGVVQKFSGPNDSMASGIGMVHQHFMLIPVFTVAQNLILGNEPVKSLGVIDIKTARKSVKDISDRFGFDVNADDLVEDLPVGVRQRVEIIKALSRDAEILILDEPTAVLTPQEISELIQILKQLKEAGKIIIFITHKLKEVQEVADEITIIRRGQVVGSAKPSDSESEMAALVVGRKVSLTTDKKPAQPSEVALEFKNVSLVEKTGAIRLQDISFQVRKGEILGIAGVQGNGQTELSEVLLGLLHPTQGDIVLNGKSLLKMSVKERLNEGVGFIPEDRNLYGLVEDFSVEENLVLDSFDRLPYGKFGSIKPKAIRASALDMAQKFDIRLFNVADKARSLSGGNQQKVVVARELNRPLQLFVASQPTRGLDVGSIEFIHQEIVAQRDNGLPVLIISTELDEIYDLSDRIAVMYRGHIVGIVDSSTDRSTIGLMMAGIDPSQSKTGKAA
ncbi:MAG: ABC transporter ATP-binding protein [Bifidobacteriaceae bacterium]|jgi:simple sugar transport system ATP-binding protein|nr:ABC transporter ATP-binding protein [Bifidobacteriaceae bacterium]